MVSFWNKLDPGLASIYSDYIDLRDLGPARAGRVAPVVASGGPVTLRLHYDGNLEDIEALGFHTIVHESPQHATGTVTFADIERVASHPGVIALVYGSPQSIALDHSAADVSANVVRAWDPFDNQFVPSGPATGKGAIIGVIDTGIDFQHLFFDRIPDPPANPAPPRKTRVLRIWDQTLEADDDTQNSPDQNLLTGGDSYGVEYKNEALEAVLNAEAGAAPVHHRDENGHGTHVASIAAGNGNNGFKYIGIAPEAALIVVKLRGLEKGAFSAKDFFDAVSYILKIAILEDLPVVINYSVGGQLGPHDGFQDDEDFLAKLFPDTATERAFVVSSGNERDNRQHARITFAGSGTIVAPFELVEERAITDGNKLLIELYYPVGPVVSVTVETPLGDKVIGPSLGGLESSRVFERFICKVRHTQPARVLTSVPGKTITLNHIAVEVKPTGKRHFAGVYKVHLDSDRATTIHAWCYQPEILCYFRVADPLPNGVTNANEELIGAPGGSHGVITVASYSAEGARALADSSSSGPVVSYDYVPAIKALQLEKPEIAAPGVDIDAAASRDNKETLVLIPGFPWPLKQRSGTSMAAPHVTGAIALMLAKNRNLTVAQIRQKLKDGATQDLNPDKKRIGAGRLNVQKSFNIS